MLARACARTLHDFGGMKRSLANGDAQLWIVWNGETINAALTTELHRINGKMRCFISALGGQGHERWLHLISGVEAFARAERCDSVVFMGRPGWQRLLKNYRTRGIIMELEL